MSTNHALLRTLALSLVLAFAGCGDGEDPKGADEGDQGHAHSEAAGAPHGGVAAPLKDAQGTAAGHLELKLHDDKGDLELGLARDETVAEPLDLPVDSIVKVKFIDKGGRTVELRARDAQTNEDEDGKPNVRDGRTNYFVFPGATGADSAWLMGGDFRSMVVATFQEGDRTYTSQGFVLVPHTHGAGHGHDH